MGFCGQAESYISASPLTRGALEPFFTSSQDSETYLLKETRAELASLTVIRCLKLAIYLCMGMSGRRRSEINFSAAYW